MAQGAKTRGVTRFGARTGACALVLAVSAALAPAAGASAVTVAPAHQAVSPSSTAATCEVGVYGMDAQGDLVHAYGRTDGSGGRGEVFSKASAPNATTAMSSVYSSCDDGVPDGLDSL